MSHRASLAREQPKPGAMVFYGVVEADGKSVIEFFATREGAETFIAEGKSGARTLVHGIVPAIPLSVCVAAALRCETTSR
jgi:hypothetical protein